jgi:putative alpha-1,2-mannosidase
MRRECGVIPAMANVDVLPQRGSHPMTRRSKLVPSIVFLPFLTMAMFQGGGAHPAKEPADYVNPYIGSISPKTGGTSPTVLVPHGAVAVAPQFTPGIGDKFLADKIFGFPAGSATIMPTVGVIKTSNRENSSQFDHDMETATPYYYQVLLEDSNISLEYTVTDNSVYFRFTFPQAASSNVLLSFSRANVSIQFVGDHAIEGSFTGGGGRGGAAAAAGTASISTYFRAEFSRPFSSFGTWYGQSVSKGSRAQSGNSIGGFASYPTSKGEQLEMKISLASARNVDEARQILAKQMPPWGFEQAKNKARALWNQALNLIRIQGGDENQRTAFYTALYRTMGRKGNVWDTHRCAYPLQTIIEPAENMKAIQGFIRDYETSGWLTDSGAMIGHHSTAVIADAYMKGLRNFDVDKAYEGMRKNHREATMIPWKDRGPLTELEQCYFDHGFFPARTVREDAKVADVDKWRATVGRLTGSQMPYQIAWLPDIHVKEWVSQVDSWHRRQSVSVTLEHSYDDWCLAQVAKALGKTSEYELFMKRAHYYQNLFDPKIGLMAPKTADGNWVEPFDPKLSGGFAGEEYFAEGNSWLYTWSVQHDVQGLIDLMGGRDKFIAKLNALFTEQCVMDKPAFLGQFPDMSGLIGNYSQGNEPAFHIPYLYDFAGAPWLTQRRVREIMKLWYNAGPFGLSGDDDGGAMSSWYVFTAMGFYPVCPGQPIYEIGSPIFDKVILNMGGGKTFVIEAKGVSERNKYIQSATLNGQPLNKPWFSHADLVKGGSIIFEMGARPNEKWGSAPEAAPPSMSTASR